MRVCRMFNTCTLHQVISDDGQLFTEKTLRHVENVTMMFNHAVNACPVHGVFYVKLRKIYGTLFLQWLILRTH